MLLKFIIKNAGFSLADTWWRSDQNSGLVIKQTCFTVCNDSRQVAH